MSIRGQRRVSVVAHIVVAFGVCIAALGAVMAMTTAASFRRERAHTMADLRVAAQSNADTAAAAVPETLSFLSGLAAQSGIQSLDPARCTAALSGLAVFAQSGNVWVVNASGSAVCSLGDGNPSAPALPPGDWVTRAQASPAPSLGELFLDARTGRPETTMFASIQGGGAIVAVFDAAMIQPVRVPANSAQEMSVVEIDGARRIVVAASTNAPVKPGLVPTGSWLAEPLGQRFTRTDSDGVTRLYQGVYNKAIDRFMFAGIPKDVALSPAQAELRRNVGVALAVVILVVLLGILMQRRIARPIRRLKRVILAAADDHLARAVPEGPSEVAAVAEAFNATMNERRELELELATALKQAQKASRLKSEFLANMSHEIRTPMNGVLGMLSLLKEVEMSADLRDYVTTMGDSADALMSILNDLLDFSKLEAGMVQAELAPFNLREAVASALMGWIAIAESKDVLVSWHVSEQVDECVLGDHLRLRQILSNLIDNAVKFTHQGRVTVSVAPGEDGVTRFEVADSGIGISVEGREHLFEPFVQADGTNTRRYGGTGLGLAICRQLVDFMGGAIGVDSTVGVGSKFWFDLPLPAADVDATVAESPDSKAKPRAPGKPKVAATPEPSVRPKTRAANVRAAKDSARAESANRGATVLVVEDNLINQKVAVQILRKLGYHPSIAADGIEAVRALDAGPFDLILMDIQMPVMDGYEATIELRRRGVGVPIVAMTASALGEDRDRCFAAGMNGYLAKPVSTQSLAAEITRVLELDPAVVTTG